MFEPGDTVVLRSGGPPMTVDIVSERYGIMTAWCSWFDGRKKVEDTFPVTSLRKSD